MTGAVTDEAPRVVVTLYGPRGVSMITVPGSPGLPGGEYMETNDVTDLGACLVIVTL